MFSLENISLSLHSKNDTAQILFSAQVAEGTIDDSVAIAYSNLPDIWFSNRCNLKNVEVSSMLHTINNLLPKGEPPKSENSNINGIKGKADIACSIKGEGKNRDVIIKSLKGTFFVAMKSGTVDNSLIVNRLSTAVEKFIKIDNITFQDLSSTCVIARKKFIIQDLKLKSNTGDWRAYGTIGFNSNISLKIKNRLTKPMSQQVIKVESGGKSILKGLLRGTRYARTAEKIINNVHIPTDREGRVTLKLSLEGTTDNPVAKFNGFSR